MTDFRHVCSLRVYSGGTARDLHPVLYSPPGPEGIQAALKPIHFSFLSLYPRNRKSQPEKQSGNGKHINEKTKAGGARR